jgi:HlyD family secretion protein
MDRPFSSSRWSSARRPLAVKIGAAGASISITILLAVKLIAGADERTVRLPVKQVALAKVERGLFHDLIPLRAIVVPRETVYVDAIDGGRVDRVLVEAGDMVQKGEPMIELSNTNLALQVIQQGSQLNQAISQLQQNEIALEQNQLSNDRALADIEYHLVRLGRSAERLEALAARGLVSNEQRDVVTDELAYYKRLRPIQEGSGQRQSDLRERLLPDIDQQLKILRGNLAIVHDKLNGLVVRAPVAGKVTAIDLKVGETRAPGQRLAEVAPQGGMKLIADVEESHLARVRVGQIATFDLDGKAMNLMVRRVSPQVRNGQFRIELDFDGSSPATLVEGAAVQGHLQLGGDGPALILPTGALVEHTGEDWVFLVEPDGRSAQRRRIKVGRRTSAQLEILSGLIAGEWVLTSDYHGFDKVDRIVLTH